MRRIWIVGVAIALILSMAVPVWGQSPVVHVVQPGENLFRISLRYGVTMDALAATNGLSNVSRIYVGQRLTISTAGTANPAPSTSSVHVVQRGESLSRIALRYGITYQAIATANSIANPNHIYVGQRLAIPGRGNAPVPPSQSQTSGQTYVVRPGDTLSAIALRFGVSTWSLVQVNNIRNPALIYVGQVLRISGGTSPAPPAPSPAPTGDRWIDVNLSTQQVTAYAGNTPVYSSLASTGLPATPTPTGQYRIYVKYVSTLMTGYGYYLPNVPYTMYFYRGYGLHGTYWHSNFGQPMSHGCINLPTPDAQWFFNWASVGTLVNIHY